MTARRRPPQAPRPAGAPPLPRTTVVVTACGDDRGLRGTLAALRRQVDRVGAELLLVVNTWPDDLGHAARQALEGFTDVLLFEPRTGKSHALNTAVRATTSEVLAFTDDDAMPAERWLEAILEPFAADPRLAGVGGPVEPVFPAAGATPWYRRLVRHRGTHFLGPKHDLGPIAQDYELPRGDSVSPVPLGASVAWRRTWLERFPYRPELGPNRETGMRGGEDTCLAIEVMEAGGRVVYAPRAKVYHPVTPERMTEEAVLAAFEAQGKEYARVLGCLGRSPADPDRMVAYVRRGALRRALERVGTGPTRTRHRMRRAFVEAACEELGLG